MTAGALPGATGVALTITPATEPAAVRDGSAAVKRSYEEDVAFENMLLEELTKSMSQTAGLGGESGEGEEAPSGEEGVQGGSSMGAGASSMVSSLLPQTLARSLAAGGGLGLADRLATELAAQTSTGANVPRGTGAAAAPAPVTSTATPSDTGAAELQSTGATASAR